MANTIAISPSGRDAGKTGLPPPDVIRSDGVACPGRGA